MDLNKIAKKIVLGILGIAFMSGIIFISGKIPSGAPTSGAASVYEVTALPRFDQPKNTVSVIVEPDDHMQKINDAITNAKSSIDLVMYNLDDAHIENLLCDAVRRNVSVRVLLNEKAAFQQSITPAQKASSDYLKSCGASVMFSPTYFTYTHQKTLVIDKSIAIVMTMNFQSKYYATSRDFGIVTSNPNDVSAIESVFESDWNHLKTKPSNGNDLLWSPGAETAMILLIRNAKKTLDVYNEEMYDDKITDELISAAKRGVNVRVTMTYASGEKKPFNKLVQGGVHVKTYSSSSKQLYIHAKMILADRAFAVIGSQNFSFNSLEKNRELGMFVTDPETIGILQTTFANDYNNARVYKTK